MDRTESAVHRPAPVLGVLSASILLDALDLSITQVALPSIQRELALDLPGQGADPGPGAARRGAGAAG